MIYGQVPYDASSVDELLEAIQNRGPLFHTKPISKKVETLIRSLLEPNPAKRMTHAALFDLVTRDQNYPSSLMDVTDAKLDRLSSFDRNSLGSADSTVEKFLKEVLLERSKYEQLVKLAQKASHFRQ